MQQGPLLLGRLVTSADAAVSAAAEGANFVLLQVGREMVKGRDWCQGTSLMACVFSAAPWLCVVQADDGMRGS